LDTAASPKDIPEDTPEAMEEDNPYGKHPPYALPHTIEATTDWQISTHKAPTATTPEAHSLDSSKAVERLPPGHNPIGDPKVQGILAT
jgi:hypothetical protein